MRVELHGNEGGLIALLDLATEEARPRILKWRGVYFYLNEDTGGVPAYISSSCYEADKDVRISTHRIR